MVYSAGISPNIKDRDGRTMKINNAIAYLAILVLLLLPACARGVPTSPVETDAVENRTNTPPVTSTVAPTALPQPTETLQPAPTSTQELVGTTTGPFMGIQVIRIDQKSQADLFKESGADWSRHDYVRWEEIEPENTEPKTYLWEIVEEDNLITASEGSRRTIAIILFTPTWAQKYPGSACGPIDQVALTDFADFMNNLVSRYSIPPYNVHYWEIGNEPDIDWKLVDGRSQYGCWGDADDTYYGGGYYAEMLKIVYPAIKAADPDSKVIVGGLVLDCDPINPPETEPNSGEYRDCTSARFLEGILEAGGGDYFDGVSFHAYDYYYGEEGSYGNAGWHSSADTTGPVLSSKTRYLRSLLDRYGNSDKELLNTESALLCGRTGKEDYCQTDDFANTKAYYVAQANAAAMAEGLQANLWYSLTGWRGSGLVDQNQAPLPAYEAYKFAASLLNEAIYKGEIIDFAGIKDYEFENEDGSFWLLWSLDGDQHAIALPEAPDAIYDVFGNSLMEDDQSTGDLDVSVAPVYVKWKR